MATQEQVFRALDNALDNGYDFRTSDMSVQEIAEDMLMYEPDFEDCGPEEVIPFIEAWLAPRPRAPRG